MLAPNRLTVEDQMPDSTVHRIQTGERDPEPSDGDVVRAILGGRDEAYAELVRRYKDVLFRYAERMMDRPDEAADVVQETFIKGFRNLNRCRDPEKVGGWLFRIAVNLCKDALKRRGRRDLSLEAAGTIAVERGNPEESLLRSELGAEIQRALQRLSPDQREAFILKHVEGWSYEEMSERLDLSVSALKMRVHRAREELQVLLESYR